MTYIYDHELLTRAHNDGVAMATRYKPGDTFLGAWGECDRIGYAPNTVLRGIFTAAYLANLPSIVVDADNTILRIGG